MDEARKINNYTIEHSFNVGEREVVMGVDETKEEPYVVAYAEFFTPACYHLMSKLTYYKNYLDAMSGYCERCAAQVQAMQEEHSHFNFDDTTLTAQDCIPCPPDESIIGKVVVMDVSKKPTRVSPLRVSVGTGGSRQRRKWRTRERGIRHLPCHRRKGAVGTVRSAWRNQAGKNAVLGKGRIEENSGTVGGGKSRQKKTRGGALNCYRTLSGRSHTTKAESSQR